MRYKYILALAFILFCLPAFAQKETGGIVGKIMDTEGNGLPGVTITISSPAFGNSVTQTNHEGDYRFPSLAPGSYEVKAELENFQTAIRKDVRVYVGNNTTINLSIGQAVEATIEITGETPAIDVTTSALSKTVPLEQVENLPKFAFALDLFTLTPGIGDLSYVAYGSGGSQANAYWFDGVDISNPVSGSYWVYPNYNWIEELQVIGLGAPAEYGGFTGVITNSVSRTGSNQFHGLFETFFQGESFTSNNVDEESDASPDRTDLFTDSTFQLGGPILQDKLWFFVGGQYYYQRYAPFGFPPAGPDAFVKDTQPRILNKLTYKANQNNTLQGFIEWDGYDRDGQAADAFTLPEATGVVEAPEWFYNTSWVSLFGSQTVLDVRFSGYTADYNILPRNGDAPQHADWPTGILSQNYWRFYLTDRSRNQLNGSVSHHASDFIKGDHDFKFGIEYERSNANRDERYTGGAYYLDDYYVSGYGYYDYRYLWEGYDSFGRIRRASAFVQDSWKITDKVNLNIGLRFDHNHVFLAEAPDIEFKTNPVAPRIGFVYDLKGDQSTILKAHYGHYYEGPITFYIDGIDDFGDRSIQYLDPGSGEWITVDFTPGESFWEIDPDLKQPFTRQFTVGVDQQFKNGWTLSAHYIYKNDEDLIEDRNTSGQYVPFDFVNPLTGETITLFNQTNPDDKKALLITNVDELFRKYHGIEVYGGKRFSNKFSMNGSVVWSRSRVNVSNSDGGANGFQLLFDDPNSNINIEGIPRHDPTWEVKVTGIYELPWDVRSSFYFRHFTGDTWTTVLRLPRSVVDQTDRVFVFLEPRGSNRLPSRNVLDFRLEKAFPIGQGDLKFTVDFFNLLNTGYLLDVEGRFDRSTFLDPLDISSPREVRLGVRYQF